MSRRRSHEQKKYTASPLGRREPPRRVAPRPSRDERVLRERILKFTYQTRFRDDFERAIRLYFGKEALQDNTLTTDEDMIPGFQEWFIQDYVTHEKERIIDLFAREVGPRLPAAQRQMLDDWRRVNRYRLFEVQAVEPGVGVTVQDLLSGEVREINDISASYALLRWQMFLGRPLLTEGRWHFAGAGIPLPPKAKPDLLQFAQEQWKKYHKRHPQASLDDFYRDHSLDLYRRAMEIATAPPPPIYTPEGHRLVPCTARYTVTDPDKVEERLDQAGEFAFAGPAEEDRTALAYVWLLTGRSRVPETPIKGEGLVMQTDWVDNSDEEHNRSLGDVRLWRDRLELMCMSRERLKAGKALLQDVLGRLVRHVGDEYKDLDEMLASAEPPRQASRRQVRTGEEQALLRRTEAEQYARWLDAPIPALGGKSPREAARDPGMREQLEEMLKHVEYTEEQKRREGGPYMDVADVRRDLGLPPR